MKPAVPKNPLSRVDTTNRVWRTLAAQIILLFALLIQACGPSSGAAPTHTMIAPTTTPSATQTPQPTPTSTPMPPTPTPIPIPDQGAWGLGPLDAPVQLMVYSDFQ
jgi:hypothetical protein